MIDIEWLSARVTALHAIGPHHAAFYLAVFPTLLFSFVYFAPAQRAKIFAQGLPQKPELDDTHAMPPIAVNTTALTAFGMALCFVIQFGGAIETSYSHWWGMAFPGVLLNTWVGAVGLVRLTALLTGSLKD